MIRLLSKNVKIADGLTAIINENSIVLDKELWKNGRRYFKYREACESASVQMSPIVDVNSELIGYIYQDIEADRELRMLRELEESSSLFQFKDVFPKINKVVIHGCNELAYMFVKYLEKQSICVEVVGKYWKYFGYSDSYFEEDENTLVLYAEGVTPQPCDLYYNLLHSVSPEFECIDKIYEKNVLEGKITDRNGDFKWLLKELEGKDIILIGTSTKSQDAYDLLCENGVEIKGFLKEQYKDWYTNDADEVFKRKWGDRAYDKSQEDMLLGKKIFSLAEAIAYFNNLVFINCMDKYSALGTRDVEILDYYGYQRNRGVFLLADYCEIPHSNLVHIMRNKNVLIAGDESLCHMLMDYLIKVEDGDINISYTDLSENITYEEGSILCLVRLWFGRYGSYDEQQNDELLFDKLHDSGFCRYTEYFSSIKSLSVIEQYLQNHMDKYSVCELVPKGIVLAKIGPGGNSFTDGIMDGHPNILMMPVGAFCNNLFLYCIRLARYKAQNIMDEFWKLFTEEATRIRVQVEFSDKEQFEKSVQRLLCLKDRFTSQELFVIFHIAYGEMINAGERIDVSQKIIYWEPHFVQRAYFTYMASWLESKKIKGYSLVVRRDNCVWTGSVCRRMAENGFRNLMQPFEYMFWTSSELDENLSLTYWEEFKMRFEDMKLRPQQELPKICEKLEIPWSDTMLHTTVAGKMAGYRGSVDFDLKAVFNKYEDYLSEFDRFRIAITCRTYQKRYGYTYESSIKFSRRELQDMFLKEFRFQKNIPFENQKIKIEYFLTIYELFRWELWEVRKRELLGDIQPEFERFEAGQQIQKCNLYVKEVFDRVNKAATDIRVSERKKIIEIINKNEKLVLYGTGKDCKAILEQVDERTKQELLFCDRKAVNGEYCYCGKKVIKPQELLECYTEYKILITSSRYYKLIQYELEKMGVETKRILCNTVQFWDD